MPISRRAFLYSAAAVSTAFASVACNTVSQSSSQEQSSSGSTVRLGFNLWSGFMPWQTAQEAKIFEENGLSTELTWFPVLSDQLTAFNTGKLDAAGITVSDMLNGVVNGVPCKVVATTDISLGADAIVTSPDIQSIQDFAGKAASVEIGTVGHLLFLTALKQAGVPQDSVQIVNQAADAAITALIAGRTKIAYSYEPFVTQAVNEGKGKVIFSSKDVPGLIPDLLVVRQELIDQNPEAVQNLVNVWYKTLNYRQQNLQQALAIEAKQAGVSVEEYEALLGGLKWLTPEESLAAFQPGQTTESLIYTAKEASDFMVAQKLLPKAAPPMTDLIDDRFLKQYLGKA